NDTAAPRVYSAAWKKLTTRLPIITPPVPPTICGVRYSPRIGMNTKMTAVTIPGRICGMRMRRIATSGVAPRSNAARSRSQSTRAVGREPVGDREREGKRDSRRHERDPQRGAHRRDVGPGGEEIVVVVERPVVNDVVVDHLPEAVTDDDPERDEEKSAEEDD